MALPPTVGTCHDPHVSEDSAPDTLFPPPRIASPFLTFTDVFSLSAGAVFFPVVKLSSRSPEESSDQEQPYYLERFLLSPPPLSHPFRADDLSRMRSTLVPMRKGQLAAAPTLQALIGRGENHRPSARAGRRVPPSPCGIRTPAVATARAPNLISVPPGPWNQQAATPFLFRLLCHLPPLPLFPAPNFHP